MKTFVFFWRNEGGYTLTEVLVTLMAFSLLAAAVLPFLLEFRERLDRWNIEMTLDQEALRFFTYIQNRNAGVRSWSMSGTTLILESSKKQGSPVRREYYLLGDHIIERDLADGGSILLALDVQNVQYAPSGDLLKILLTLKKGSHAKTYEGFLARSLER